MNLSWLTDTPIAHRGLHNEQYPENSFGAFVRGAEAGYNLELDVHLTRDGEIVVVHDENMKRVTGEDILITACGGDTGRSVKLCGTQEGIPTLQEVLDMVAGRVGLIIEIKKDKCCEVGVLEEKLVAQLAEYKGNFVIKSFDPYVVGWMRKHAPHIVTGQLASNFENKEKYPFFVRFTGKHLLMLPFNHAQFVSFDATNLPNRAVARCKKRGMPILAWTIRSQEQADRALQYADVIIFEKFIPKA